MIELVKRLFWYLFKPRMVGWSDQDSRGLHEGGGNSLKYLKRGWNRKEGRGNKDFKKGGQAGSRGGCLKKGGNGTPLWTMSLGKRSLSEFPKTFQQNIFSFNEQKSHVHGILVGMSFSCSKSGNDQKDQDLWCLIDWLCLVSL